MSHLTLLYSDIKINNIINEYLNIHCIPSKTKFGKFNYINYNYYLQYYRILCIYKYINSINSHIIQYILSFLEFPICENINKNYFYNELPLIELPLIELNNCEFIFNESKIKLCLINSLSLFGEFIKQIDSKFSSEKFKCKYFNKENKIPLYYKSIQNNIYPYLILKYKLNQIIYYNEEINSIINLEKYFLLSSKIKIIIKLSELWHDYDKNYYGMNFNINKIILYQI